MSVARQVRISFRAKGLGLEGVISHPQGLSGPMPGILLCHPEPHLGGTMESAVIQALARALSGRGFLVLRFNYRGVGQSEGKFSMGVGELEDARAAFKVLRTWPGVDGDRMGIAGYSFGAGIAVRAALREKAIQAAVAVSPPLTLPPLGLQGVKGLESTQLPLLFLIGGKDGLTSPGELQAWFERLGNSKLRLAVVPGADRSWQGHVIEMAGQAARFLVEALA